MCELTYRQGMNLITKFWYVFCFLMSLYHLRILPCHSPFCGMEPAKSVSMWVILTFRNMQPTPNLATKVVIICAADKLLSNTMCHWYAVGIANKLGEIPYTLTQLLQILHNNWDKSKGARGSCMFLYVGPYPQIYNSPIHFTNTGVPLYTKMDQTRDEFCWINIWFRFTPDIVVTRAVLIHWKQSATQSFIYFKHKIQSVRN